MQVRLVETEEDSRKYEKFASTHDQGLLYYSVKYRDFLRSFLEAEDYYLLLEDDGETVGILPLFLKRNNTYGNILNSLPFFGSHGGPLVSVGPEGEVKLLEALRDLEYSFNCVSSTIISGPFGCREGLYQATLCPTLRDFRIGQMLELPNDSSDDTLFYRYYHESLRRNIRKALKSGVRCKRTEAINELHYLHSIHQANMKDIGGLAKPEEAFNTIPKIFDAGRDYLLYLAEKDGKRIAGLLVFLFNSVAEYFVPAMEREYRSVQPLSLLIHTAIKDCIQMGYRFFNFGGTWQSQTGVYKFKKKWGAKDKPYYYFTTLYKPIGYFKEIGVEGLLQEYRYFYVLPFDHLQ